ncbi:hypothetical protein EV648_10237 [Kribbella sp. VKM Ac-2568]|nr:hypothetical protein EV648_10237 [Kribbella sp. VKM Ac-2568]
MHEHPRQCMDGDLGQFSGGSGRGEVSEVS